MVNKNNGNFVVICDIDGTIADGSHREHLVANNPKNWKAYFELCHLDKPIETVIRIIRGLYVYGRTEIYFVSGRCSSVRKKTENWINEHVGEESYTLFMRPEGDVIQDDLLKERILHKDFLDKGIIPDIVFDDRRRVVEMWRRNGIQCLECRDARF